MSETWNIIKRHLPYRNGIPTLSKRISLGLKLTYPNSYVIEKQWERLPNNGAPPTNPLPWLPYCLTTLLDTKLPTYARILEFGAGWGTMFWDNRQIVPPVAIERNPLWLQTLSKHNLPVQPNPPPNRKFNLIIIDSHPKNRKNDLLTSRDALISKNGIIILDDTHRDYESSLGSNHMNEWKSLYLEGLGPWSHQKHGSTLFYRPGNILRI